ncbi:MAG: glycosyltransferase 87 family protein [Acidobacteriaceae bacterium]
MTTLSGEINQLQTSRQRRLNSAKKILRTLAIASLLFAGVFISVLLLRPAARDYISYWSAARLLVHHIDPYSPARVFALEKAQGDLATHPIIMRNPPWAMFLVVPLAFGSPFATLFFWTLASIGCILIFARLLRVPSKDRAFAFVFAPAVSCVFLGQSSAFLLLGFALFLYLHQRHPFLSGAALLLMAIKPHLFLVFWAVLLADCIYRRRFLILAGGAAAFTAATAFAMALDPRIWQQYVAMLRASALEHEFFPTASMLIRVLINRGSDWLLFVPSALGIIWGLRYYKRNRQAWDWRIHGMLLLLVTVTVSPYGWFADSIVLLPPIVFALASPQKHKYSAGILMAINTIALVILLVIRARITSPAYVWLPLAILVWFLYTLKKPQQSSIRLASQVAG